MIIRALLIDDEPLAHNIILEYASEVPFLQIVGQCYLATEALDFLKQQEVDLLFLDIHMPKLKGLDFLRILNNKPQVIITSAHGNYALESFELDVCDYLLKPFRLHRFLKAVHKAYDQLQLRRPATSSPLNPPNDAKGGAEVGEKQLFIKSDKRIIRLSWEDIYFLESHGNYVKVWLEHQFHLTPRTLSSFEQKLPGELFSRVHKSYIIHKQCIDYLEGNRLVLVNGKTVPIGKNYRHLFRNLLDGE